VDVERRGDLAVIQSRPGGGEYQDAQLRRCHSVVGLGDRFSSDAGEYAGSTHRRVEGDQGSVTIVVVSITYFSPLGA
jgi:hypothetical protein